MTQDAASRLDVARDVAARGVWEPIPPDLLGALLDVADEAAKDAAACPYTTPAGTLEALARLEEAGNRV